MRAICLFLVLVGFAWCSADALSHNYPMALIMGVCACLAAYSLIAERA